jgi:WD40 repeat protein
MQVAQWRASGRKAEVTCLARSHNGALVAAGYADGAIVVWRTADGAEGTAFQGHRGAVTALCFDADDARLASGARDTTVIVWDVVAERGLFRSDAIPKTGRLRVCASVRLCVCVSVCLGAWCVRVGLQRCVLGLSQ